MPLKKIFVLANSIKKQQRCVAGREIVKYPDGEEYWGKWIRPITHHDEGAISLVECRLQDGTIPVPLNVIQVPVTANDNSFTQPENWYIQQGIQWSKITSWGKDTARDLIEAPENLLLEPGVKQDRVTSQYLLSQTEHQSLYLIQPVNFRFIIEVTTWEGVEKKRRRGIFSYNGQSYNFSMTDPVISQKYFPDFTNVHCGEVELDRSSEVLICVSLTPEFNGYHYKIVATVIEI